MNIATHNNSEFHPIGLQIRLATHSDLPAVVNIYNQSIPDKQATADLTPVSIAERQAWFDAHLTNAHTRPLLVAVKDHQIVGWGGFTDLYSRPAYHISSEISLYIDESAKGQGVGKALLQALLNRAPSCGIQQVLAKIFAHNQPSLSLFRQYDFREWGILPQVCDMDGFIADVVILGRSIKH